MQPLFFDEDLSSASNFDDHEQSIDLNGKRTKLPMLQLGCFRRSPLFLSGMIGRAKNTSARARASSP